MNIIGKFTQSKHERHQNDQGDLVSLQTLEEFLSQVFSSKTFATIKRCSVSLPLNGSKNAILTWEIKYLDVRLAIDPCHPLRCSKLSYYTKTLASTYNLHKKHGFSNH